MFRGCADHSLLRSHLLDDVEHLFEVKSMLAEDRGREVVEVRLALLVPVLLGVFAGRSSLNDVLTLAMDTRLRLAEPGETETFEASFTRRKEDPS
jgi:hypothetical protein